MPTFFSNSGDLIFSDLVTGLRVNLSRNLTGNFDITGDLTLNSRSFLQTDSTLSFDPNSGMLLGGTNTAVSGEYNFVVNGQNNTVRGSNNTVLFSIDSEFEDGCDKNILIGGDTITFVSGVTGSVLIADDRSIRTVDQSHKLIIDFQSGQRFINNTVFETNTVFENNIDVTGNADVGGDFTVIGVADFQDDFGVSGIASFDGDVTINGDTTIIGDFNASGDFDITGSTFDFTGSAMRFNGIQLSTTSYVESSVTSSVAPLQAATGNYVQKSDVVIGSNTVTITIDGSTITLTGEVS